MTRILAIDTSSAWCSVALSCGDNLPFFRHEPVSAGASQLLLPWIEAFLIEADASLQDLDAIAIGVGPGAFTGVRLGLAVTQGLAISTALPVLPIASLDAIAAQLVQSSHFKSSDAKTFAVLIDARMDEVYWAKYHVSTQRLPSRIGDIQLSKPEKIDLSDVQFIAGSAVSEYGERLLMPQSKSLSEKCFDKTIGVSALGVLDCAQVYWAKYHVSTQGLPSRIGDIQLSKPEKIDLSDVQFIAGSAVSEYAERLLMPQSISLSEKYFDKTIGVSALGILDCAQVNWAQGKQMNVSALEPLYIRNKVALTTEERMKLHQDTVLK